MEVRNFHSKCNKKFNAKILRFIESATAQYPKELAHGFEARVEILCTDNKDRYEPLYDLIVENGGGFPMSVAEAQMNFLRSFPERRYTGYDQKDELLEVLKDSRVGDLNPDLYNSVAELMSPRYMTNIQHHMLQELTGFSLRYGAISIPFTSLTTEGKGDDQAVRRTTGRINALFNGGTEWQNLFFAFNIARTTQEAMLKYWKSDQITFETKPLTGANDCSISFYAKSVRLWSHCSG